MSEPTPIWGIHPVSQVLADQPTFVVGTAAEAAHVAASYLHGVPGGIKIVRYMAWDATDITCLHELRAWEEKQRERKDSPEDDSKA